MIKNRIILQGDVLEKLKEIPDNSIDCEITSPPYFGLRNYGIEGQWGLELDFHDYLKKMQKFMKEMKRVLKPTGSCWINLGDCYGSHSSNKDNKMGAEKQEQIPLKGYEKSRLGIPERFYIQCIDDGWKARNHIPWIKRNPMPSSVKDRFTNTWESIFFFVKEKRYYFNLDAVRVKPKTETKPFNVRVRDAKKGLGMAKLGDDPKAWKMSEDEDLTHNKKGERKQDSTLGANGRPKMNYQGFNQRWKERKWGPEMGTISSKHSGCFDADGNNLNHPQGKNPGDVFFINPQPFPDAHFATFPIKLPLEILKCACPSQVCQECEEPRRPIIKPTPDYQRYLDSIKGLESGNLEKGYQNYKNNTQSTTASYVVVAWSKCNCNTVFKSGIVLDPFFGVGTVGVAAEMLGLNWMGIELSEKYIDIATRRLEPFMNERLFQ